MYDKKKFQINYQIVYIGGSVSKEKQINISNCLSALHAQVRLEDYLKRKYPDFSKLVVITCIEDMLESIFGKMDISMNNIFNEVFKK